MFLFKKLENQGTGKREGLNSSLGTRCEIKNMNSIKNIQKAIEFEIKRQVKIFFSLPL